MPQLRKISFNGTIVPYLFRCPRSLYLRAVKKLYPPREEADPLVSTPRQLGIDMHDALRAYFTGEKELVSPLVMTDLLDELYDTAHTPDVTVYVEHEFLFDEFMNPIETAPKEGPFIYMRPDLVLVSDDQIRVFDWKGGNPDYGATQYHLETEFFLAGMAALYPDIGLAETIIYFPYKDYVLPTRTFNRTEMGSRQTYFTNLIDRILKDNLCWPTPSRMRCSFCDYRSEEAGGMHECEDTAV